MLERWQHWLTPLFNEIPTLAVAALFFLLLALVVNRGNLRQTLARLLPRGLKVNLAVYALDILIVAGPLGYLLKQLSLFIAGHGFTIFDEASPASLPAPLLLLLTVFVGDGISYFRHRLEHSRLLWPAHVLHHSDDDMSWFTVFRFHPLNRLSTTVIDIGLLLALGIPGWAIAANLLIRHYYGMFIHAALPWTYGPLGRVLVSPAMHRWHHVLHGRGINSNYATVFSVFDQIFGSYYVPGPCTVPLGVRNVRHDALLEQLLLPLTALSRAVLPARARRKATDP